MYSMDLCALSDLASWLLSCIEDDERVTRLLADAPEMWFTPEADDVLPSVSIAGIGGPKKYHRFWLYGNVTEWGWVVHDSAIEIGRDRAARVLAECEAKRKIVELDVDGREHWQILRLLAQPYADRPGFDEAWK